jgi:predicted porin
MVEYKNMAPILRMEIMETWGVVRAKKVKYIAFGLLSLPVFAYAQQSVTLYGTVDVGFLYTSKSVDPSTGKNAGANFQLINSGSSRSVFGLRGVEDLGGGTKLKFQLENGFSVTNGGYDNSNGNFWGRQAWVSVSNNLGELKAGLQFSPFINALWELDARELSQFGSNQLPYSAYTFTGTFVSNAVSYTTPKIAGLTASLLYAFGGVPGNFQAGRQYSASVKYEFGPLSLVAAIDDASDGGDTTIENTFFESPLVAKTIGIIYHFSILNLKGSYANYKSPQSLVGGALTGGNNDVWNIGVDWWLQPYLDLNYGISYIRDRNDSSSHAFTSAFGATYLVSKRTMLYAQAGIVNNKGRQNIGLSIDGALTGVEGTTVGANVGLTHRF